MGDGEKAVAILNGNILATDQAFYQIMYDDISENDLSYEEKTTNADGTPAAYLPKFGGGNRYRLVKLELLSRYYATCSPSPTIISSRRTTSFSPPRRR